MTLNGVMALILRYFTEIFVYDVVAKQLLGLPPFQKLSAQLFSDYLGKTNW